MTIFLDGDFNSGKGDCKHYCSPSCHPAQIGSEWVYECLHQSWPQNRERDFCPIINCGGDTGKCEIGKYKWASYYKRGLRLRIKNAKAKILKWESELYEIEKLLDGGEK